MKKIARYLAIALMATCLILAFVACMSIPTKNSTSTDTSDQPQATLTFTTDSITVEQYQQADVSAALTEGEGEIEYSIDDPDVLIMNGTHVLAVKPGTAIVTAKVTSLNLTATCTVTVTEAADKPAFSQSDSVTMYYGAEEQLDGELLRGGEPFTYATVSYSTEGEILSVDEQGNLTALVVGTQNVKITAKIGNYTVAEKDVAVTVKEYGYIETGIENNEINLTATALAEGAISEYALDALNASVNFEDVENPTFNFETDNENVAVVEGSAVKATGVGTAHITVTYTSSNATYDTVLTVNVTREILEATASAEYLLATDGKVAIDATALSYAVDAATLEKAFVAEDECTFTVEGNTVFVTSDKFGAQSITLVDGKKTVTFASLITDNAITTAEQFMTYFSQGQMNAHKYTILANDIDMQGASWDNWTNDFATVFDGLGHTVSNFTMKYLFYKSSCGTIKNVTLNNFGYSDLGIFGGWWHDDLTVENVTINAYQTRAIPEKMLLFYTNETWGISFTNCTFNITAFDAETPYSLFNNENYYDVTMVNVTVNYTGTLNKVGENGFSDAHIPMSNVILKDIRDFGVEYNADYLVASEGKVALDLSKFSKTVASVTAVTVNGAATTFAEADGTLTVDCAATGNVAFKFTMAENEYTCNLLVADYAISTAEQFKTYFSNGQMNIHKYTVLANDIDMQDAAWDNWSEDFATVFDGLNHTVSNFKMGYGLFYKANGGTLRNVTFNNFGYGYLGIFGGYWTNGFTVENVTINAYQTQAIPEKTILFDYNQDWAMRFVNCTFNVTAYEPEVAYTLFLNSDYYDVTMINVTVNYTGILNKVGENGFSSAHIPMTNVTLKDKRDT